MPNPGYGTSGYGQSGYGNQPIQALPIGYYIGLLTHQYVHSPKLNALLYVLLKKFDDASQCLIKLDTTLDLDSAVGVQLDMLGVIVNASRTLPFQPSFSVSPILDDDSYRIYIKAKIGQNQWDGTITGLYLLWRALFPDINIVVADNQNMSATLFISGSPSSIILDMIAGYAVNGATSGIVQNGLIVPRPESVEFLYDFGELPSFGFDLDNSYVAGFDIGKWA